MRKIRDGKELEQALIAMGARAGSAVLRGAVRDALKLQQKEARRLIPKKTGESAKHIKIRVLSGKGKRSDVVTGFLGAVTRQAFKLKFIEKGTAKHAIPNKTVGRGRHKRKNKAKVVIGGRVFSRVNHPGSKPNPFLKPAFDAKQKQSVRIFGERVYQRIILRSLKQ